MYKNKKGHNSFVVAFFYKQNNEPITDKPAKGSCISATKPEDLSAD
jgi:hypothetical protein